jgi:hypothetical protein
MCFNCGCGEYQRRHKPSDITLEDLAAAAVGQWNGDPGGGGQPARCESSNRTEKCEAGRPHICH